MIVFILNVCVHTDTHKNILHVKCNNYQALAGKNGSTFFQQMKQRMNKSCQAMQF